MMLNIAYELKDESKIMYTQMSLGDTYRSAENHDSAIMMYNMAIQTSNRIGDSLIFAYCLQGIGLDYAVQNYYDKAVNYYLQAIRIGDSAHFSTFNFTENIAQAYLKLKKYDEA